MINETNIELNLEILRSNNTSFYTFQPIFETIDSTNTYIKNNLNSLENKSVILAKYQTKGRGRYDRNFVSNNDKGIYCSFLLKENLHFSLLNLKIACALHHSIKETFNINTYIKWPNDLMINNKKCAGILIETQFNQTNLEAIIIGFGLNIFKQKFDTELERTAISLEEYKNQTYNRNKLLNTFFNKLDYFLSQNDTIGYFRNHMIPKETFVNLTINNAKEIVKIIDLNSEGQLIVETKNNEILTLFNEEITL